MSIPILIAHFIYSLFFTSPLFAFGVVLFTALWYVFIDRGLLNILMALTVRPIFILLNGGKVPENIVVNLTLIIELVKAPVSAYLGLRILLSLLPIEGVIIPFAVGLILWSLNFHFIGGVFRNHPYNKTMFAGVVIGTGIVAVLIPYSNKQNIRKDPLGLFGEPNTVLDNCLKKINPSDPLDIRGIEETDSQKVQREECFDKYRK